MHSRVHHNTATTGRVRVCIYVCVLCVEMRVCACVYVYVCVNVCVCMSAVCKNASDALDRNDKVGVYFHS